MSATTTSTSSNQPINSPEPEQKTALDKLNRFIALCAANPPNAHAPETIRDWFLHNGIRTAGEWTEPLFYLADIGSLIGDKHYYRYNNPECISKVIVPDTRGRNQECLMVTEDGLIEYLLQSRRPEAKPFKSWVIGVIKMIRKTIISAEECKHYDAYREATGMKLNTDKSWPGYVYYIEASGANDISVVVKIGRSVKPEMRLKGLQTANHCQLKLLHVFYTDNCVADEVSMHAKYHEYRLGGEWFKIPRDILEINLVCSEVQSLTIHTNTEPS